MCRCARRWAVLRLTARQLPALNLPFPAVTGWAVLIDAAHDLYTNLLGILSFTPRILCRHSRVQPRSTTRFWT